MERSELAMRITIESNDGAARHTINVNDYGPIGTNLFSLKTVLELVTAGMFQMHRVEERQAHDAELVRDAALESAREAVRP